MASASDSVGLVTGSIRSLSAAARNLGVVMTAGSAAAAAGMYVLAQRAERVSEGFREVGSIASETNDAQARYGELVSDINTEMGVQADQLDVIEGLYQSVSAGVDQSVDSQREFLTTASQLAVVGRVDLATAVDVISTSMNAYGKGTEFAQRASEALFRTVQFGKVTLEELAPVMGRITALGAEMGINIEELGASMAVLTRNGFEARVAATGVRAILRSMMKPSEQMQQMLRDIALEQDLFAESMGTSADRVREVAEEYKNATDAVQELEAAQQSHRETQEEASLAIQEARLKMEAIEEGRLDQLPELTNEEVKNAESVKELESIVDDYQFTVNKARIQEEKARQSKEDASQAAEELRNEFKENLSVHGDLSQGVGQLVIQNQGLVETLTQLREKSDEQGVGFQELFPRTRALQGALALVGEDAELLNEIFNQMQNEGLEPAMDTLEKNRDELEMSQEEYENMKDQLKDLPELYEDMTGSAQGQRNAFAKMRETLVKLGEVFKEDIFAVVNDIAGAFDKLGKWLDNLDESAKRSIGRFSVLAATIGLVLGPILLFGGQIAMIASALGAMFLPVVGLVIGVLAALSFAFTTVAQGGKEAENMIQSMRNFLKLLIAHLISAKNVLVNQVIPAVKSFLKDALNAALPGLKDFALGVWAVISALITFGQSDEGQQMLSKLADALVVVIGATADLLGWFGRLMQGNSGLIADFLVFAAAVITIAKVVGGLIVVFSALSSGIGAIISVVTIAYASITAFGALLTGATSIAYAAGVAFQFLSAAIALIGGPITLLIALVAVFGAAWATNFLGIRDKTNAVIGAIIDLFWWLVSGVKGVFKAIKNAIFNVVPGLLADMKDIILGGLKSIVSGAIDAGLSLVTGFAKGIKKGIGKVKDAAKGMADTAASYLPGSPAEQGPLSKGPKERGLGTSEDFAAGIEEGVTSVDSASNQVASSATIDPEEVNNWEGLSDRGKSGASKYMKDEEESAFGGSGMPSGGMGGGVTVEEKAIYFEKGAFQGVADDEIPEMVEEEVDDSLDEILEEQRSKGRGTR